VKRDKRRDGFLFGKCKRAPSGKEASPYANRFEGEVMVFHPDDPMHMPCYASRWNG
jgi:hypothetical protein